MKIIVIADGGFRVSDTNKEITKSLIAELVKAVIVNTEVIHPHYDGLSMREEESELRSFNEEAARLADSIAELIFSFREKNPDHFNDKYFFDLLVSQEVEGYEKGYSLGELWGAIREHFTEDELRKAFPSSLNL